VDGRAGRGQLDDIRCDVFPGRTALIVKEKRITLNELGLRSFESSRKYYASRKSTSRVETKAFPNDGFAQL